MEGSPKRSAAYWCVGMRIWWLSWHKALTRSPLNTCKYHSPILHTSHLSQWAADACNMTVTDYTFARFPESWRTTWGTMNPRVTCQCFSKLCCPGTPKSSGTKVGQPSTRFGVVRRRHWAVAVDFAVELIACALTGCTLGFPLIIHLSIPSVRCTTCD